MENVGDWLHQLFNIIAKVGPIEVIDVIVVSLILYQLLRLVRGTQALQLLVGLVLLAIVGVVASQLKPGSFSSGCSRNAAPFVVIAVIVLFQPELRRMLDQVGRIGHLGGPLGLQPAALQPFHRGGDTGGRAMAHGVWGALIAFEREVGLEDYAATGVRINGTCPRSSSRASSFRTRPYTTAR